MPRFTTESLHAGAPEALFAHILDLTQWPLFTGYGPLPGIAEASLPEGGEVRLGTAIRVRNTDGSVHHERVRTFDRPYRYAVRMELVPPASNLMQWIDEDVELRAVPGPNGGGTLLVRTFETKPVGWYTWPLVWVLTHFFLKPAVHRHNRASGGT